MDSDSREKIRWGSEIKVYTRRNVFPAATVTAAVAAAGPESGDAAAQAEEHLGKVVTETQELLIDNVTSGDVPGGVELREGSCSGSGEAVVANEGTVGGHGGGIQEVDDNEIVKQLGGVELREGSCSGDGEAVISNEGAVGGRGGGTQEEGNEIVKPLGGVELLEGSCSGDGEAVIANEGAVGGRGGGTQEVCNEIVKPLGGVELREGSCSDGAVGENEGAGGEHGGGTQEVGNEIVKPLGGVELREGSCSGNGEALVANEGADVERGGATQEVGNEIVKPLGSVELLEGSCSGGALVANEGAGGGTQEVGNEIVRPLISRDGDRVRISLSGGNLNVDEIRELRRKLEGELDQVRSVAKKIEAKEQLQLTPINSGDNRGRTFVGIPGGGIISRSRAQYTRSSDSVVDNRSFVRVKHSQPRPYRPPSLAVVVSNNNAVGEFVEREKRTPKANPYYKNSEFLLGMDRLPSESNKKLKANGGGKKDRVVSRHGFAFDDDYRTQLFRSCTELLQRLMNHRYSWVFNEPVNVKALGLHDYLDIIKHPMDLGTIKARLFQKWYKSPAEFAEDIRLVFNNAKTYNPKGQDVHIMAEELSQIFEGRWAAIEAKFNPAWRYQTYHDAGLPTPTSRKRGRPPSIVYEPVTYHALTHAPQARTLERSESITGAADSRKKKPLRYSHVGRPPVLKKPKAKDPNKRDMTYDEKQKLSKNLENLPQEKLESVIQIIKKRSSALSQTNEEIEVDIDSVDRETLWELDRFVANYKKSLSKNKRKAELALQARARAAQSAPVTSSDPMVANAPSTHVEGGRQADNASSSSSSSSSSSDSGSSSSDSDSDSSSACGSDAGH